MNTELNGIFRSHAEWLESEGESGEQLILENVNSEQLTFEQIQFLTESILTECTFTLNYSHQCLIIASTPEKH